MTDELFPKPGFEDFDDDDDDIFEPLDAIIGDDAPLASGVGSLGPVEHEIIDPATPPYMCCLRGPCKHLFTIAARHSRTESRFQIAHARACIAGPREMDLTDQSVYRCTQWKPSWASWMPDSVWFQIRPYVQALYERYYERAEGGLDWLDHLRETAKREAQIKTEKVEHQLEDDGFLR